MEDVQDQPPEFTNGPYSATVAENTPPVRPPRWAYPDVLELRDYRASRTGNSRAGGTRSVAEIV